MYVEVRGDTINDLERALSQFSKLVKKDELMKQLKNNEFHLKKSKKLERKRQDARRKRKIDLRKMEKKSSNEF